MGSVINTSMAVNWNNPLNRGLVAWYLANPSLPRGNKWKDLCGLSAKKGNDGTLTNGPTWKGNNGRIGGYGCMSFDGTDDYINCGSSSLFNSSHFTVSSYSKINVAATNGIVDKDRNNAWGIYYENSTTKIKFNLAGTEVVAGSTFVTNVWYHVVATYDGDNQTLYIGGLQSATMSRGSVPLSNTQNMYIGRLHDGFYFNGMMDDIKYYNRALSASEVQQLYLESNTGQKNTLRWED